MSERSNIRGFSEDLAKTPGPARYGSTENNIYLKKNPQEHALIWTPILNHMRIKDFRKLEIELNADH